MSSPIAATAPLVQGDWIAFHLPDPDEELAGVRLATDRGFPFVPAPFVHERDGWTLRMPAPSLARFEYALAVRRADDTDEHWTDPANPLRAPGAFGEKSVVALPGYEEPAWLTAERVPGATDTLTVASSALGAELQITLWRPDDARDDEPPAAAGRSRRPRARPARPAHRLRGGADRLRGAAAPSRGAAGARRARPVVLGERAVRAHARDARAARDRRHGGAAAPPVGTGASLGGLAMLHAQRRFPDVFAGLFLQSGSFFMPRFDSQESGFVRYRRIVRFVRATLREPPRRTVPVALTCGALEENADDNRVMASALAAQGYPVDAGRGPRPAQLHRLARRLDPHLTRLLGEVWR